jgi:BolA protein
MSIESALIARLTITFSPTRLQVVNESHKHAGHSGDDGSGESHFAVLIRADALAAMGRVARHRAVHQALGDLNQRIHALALDIG